MKRYYTQEMYPSSIGEGFFVINYLKTKTLEKCQKARSSEAYEAMAY